MLFNIVSPHLVNGLYYFMLGTSRCCDRGCTCDERRTKKITQTEYEELNKGPKFDMEFRYSSVLYVIWVTMTYSSGLPILYFVAVIYFFVTYWVDKFLIFHYYRLPPNYSVALSNASITLMKFSIIVHYIFGYFMFSYAPILPSSLFDSKLLKEVDTNTQYFNVNRLSQTHTFIYLCAFAAILIFYLLKFVVFNVFRAFCEKHLKAKIFKEERHNLTLSQYCDDIYQEVGFVDLFKEFKKTIIERKTLKDKYTEKAKHS